ncbi:MAG: hypothetical protein AB1640_22985 [bacterium]
MARYYGEYLYKELLRNQLGRTAQVVESATKREGRAARSPSGADLARIAELSGLEDALLLIRREQFRILYPAPADLESSSAFLGDEGAREELLRTLSQMVMHGSEEGYFSLTWEGNPGPHEQRHFVFVAPAGSLLCVLLLPEQDMQISGGSLAGALPAVVAERLRGYLLLSIPFVMLASVLIWLAARGAAVEPGPSATEEAT